MTIRERTEELEERMLAPYAALSKKSLGRDAAEEPCDIRTCYRRDCDRIIHCKAFRRLKRKTQVFLSPEGDHYRTRLTHTLEVAQIARTIARALRLNEDLTEAISLGHDLGHTPFGHAGERALNGMIPGGFRHYEQSVRVVEKLEKDGKGLNLTKEVRDGILCHTRGKEASTLEGRIVKISDRIAYINHDIDDAQRAGVLLEKEIPEKAVRSWGPAVPPESTLWYILWWKTAAAESWLWSLGCRRPLTSCTPLCMSMCTTIPAPRGKRKRFRSWWSSCSISL